MTVARTFTYEIVAYHDQRPKLIKIMSITWSPFLIYIVSWEICGTPLHASDPMYHPMKMVIARL